MIGQKNFSLALLLFSDGKDRMFAGWEWARLRIRKPLAFQFDAGFVYAGHARILMKNGQLAKKMANALGAGGIGCWAIRPGWYYHGLWKIIKWKLYHASGDILQ